MIRICAAVAMLSFAAPALAETIGTNPMFMCPTGSYIVQLGQESYRCRAIDGALTAPKIGLSVWAPLVEPVKGECAPGYEQACDARDHGVYPVQPYGGGR
jgi:hypothetical protein